jgi:hypothetical protein
MLLPSNRTPGHFIKAHIIMAAGNDPLRSGKGADRAAIEGHNQRLGWRTLSRAKSKFHYPQKAVHTRRRFIFRFLSTI